MNLILRDYLHRWRWLLALSVLLVITRLSNIGLGKPQSESGFASFVVVYTGPMDLLIDLGRGYALILLLLPVTVKKIARAWWWAAVGLPALALTVLSLLAFLITGMATGHWRTLPAFGGYCAANVLMLGALFFTITDLPAGTACPWPKKIRGFSAIAFCLWCFYGNHSDLNTPSGKVFAAVAGVMTVWGWFRAESLVQEHLGSRQTATGARRSVPTAYRPGAGGGLEFLFRHFYLRMVLTGLVIIGGFALFSFWPEDQIYGSLCGTLLTVTLQSGGSLLHVLILAQIFPACLHVRVLRTLPLSAGKVAAVLVFTPLLAILTVVGFGTVVLAAITETPLNVLMEMLRHAFWLPLGLVLLAIPMLVWRGWDKISGLMLGLLIGSSAIFSMFKITDELSGAHIMNLLPPADAGSDTATLKLAAFPEIYNLYAALLVLAAFLLTKLALERSSLACRPRLGALNSPPGMGVTR